MAPKEHYEKTVEARWMSIRKYFARELLGQNNVPQLHYWFWCFKDMADMSNAFLQGHSTKTPFNKFIEEDQTHRKY